MRNALVLRSKTRGQFIFLRWLGPIHALIASINDLLTIIGQLAALTTEVQTMDMSRIYGGDRADSFVAVSPEVRPVVAGLVTRYLGEAEQGDAGSLFDLGVTSSTGSHGVAGDFIEAHKWFNLAAMAGHECAKGCRADISGEMTAGEIAEAQRRAREWIAAARCRAA